MRVLILFFVLLFASSAIAQEAVPVSTPIDGANNLKSPSTDELVKIRKRVEFLLSGYEFFPKRSDLDTVGPPDVVSGVLRDIVEDSDSRPSMRTRAVDALGFYDDDETKTFLTQKMAKEVTVKGKIARVHKSIRHHAITAFARSMREKSVGDLSPYLRNKNLQIRLTAISALGKFGGKDGKLALVKAKKDEKHNVAKSAFRKFVPDGK